MNFVTLLLIALVGLVTHWAKRYSRGQLECSFTEYMQTHKRNTIASLATAGAAVVALYSTGDLEMTNQTMALAFLAGYAGDSAVNKGPGE